MGDYKASTDVVNGTYLVTVEYHGIYPGAPQEPETVRTFDRNGKPVGTYVRELISDCYVTPDGKPLFDTAPTPGQTCVEATPWQ